MPVFIFQNQHLEIDENGFIQDFNAWSEDLAQHMANSAGMSTLKPNHWKVLYFLREYYLEHELAPPIRVLCKETQLTLKTIYQLFPAGPARSACRMAGLPKPTGCA
jgi:dissimilatory sulfite reductase related protein